MKILNLKEVTRLLNYKNCRTAIRWCRNNGVKVMSHLGTNRKFVDSDQFEWALYGRYSEIVKNENILSEESESNVTTKGKAPVANYYKSESVKYYKSRLLQKLNKI